MPIYMDLHIAPGVNARAVAEAHVMDTKIQENFDCKAMTYWVDEEKGCVFCLIEAPDAQSVKELHAKSHGLIPHEVIEVNTDVVRAFLGRIQDPEHAVVEKQTNLKVFNDPAFRVLVLSRTTDSRLLEQQLGKERAADLLQLYSTIIRDECKNNAGSEVFRREQGFVMSFSSHDQALDCALAIKKKLQRNVETIGLTMAIHGGMPVNKNDQLFGSTIQLAQFLTRVAPAGQIIMTSQVRDLFKDNNWNLVTDANLKVLNSAEDAFVESLVQTLEARWTDPEFDVMEFCDKMNVSKSQLYRKSVAVTGMSPNDLLREFRLLNALELLRKEDRNIAQTTFDTGFSSPSYFTKCFQKRFGIQPLAYAKGKA